MKPILLVLAAGLGSRYGGLKQIEPIGPNGESIMDYSIYDAIEVGFGKLVFVIRRDIDEIFRNRIGVKYENIIPVEYIHQEIDILPENIKHPENRIKPWGTGHAVWISKKVINAPFGVINADDYYGRNSFRLLYEFLTNKIKPDSIQYALIGYRLKNTLSEYGSVARAICRINSDSQLIDITEYTNIEKKAQRIIYTDVTGREYPIGDEEIVSMNIWGFTPTIFPFLEKGFIEFYNNIGEINKSEFFLPMIIKSLIQKQLVSVQTVLTSDAWFGMTYPEDRNNVQAIIKKLIANNIYPAKLWN